MTDPTGPAAGALDYRVLGPIEVWSDGTRVAIGSAKHRRLLAALVFHANRPLTVDRVVDLLWDDPPATATTTAQTYLSRVRQTLHKAGHDVLTRTPAGYLLRLDDDQVDAVRFDRAIDRAETALVGGDAEQALSLLDDAIALWRGEAMVEITGDDEAARAARFYTERRALAEELRIDALLKLGRSEHAAAHAERAASEHPLRESTWSRLALALYRAGRPAEAIRQLGRLRTRLVEELGIDPSAEIANLERRLLSHDPDLLADADQAVGPATATLEVVSGAPARRIPVPAAPSIIGRSPEAEISQPDVSNLSRLHARIEPAAGGWLISDLGSRNGTKVNGERLRAARALRDGDEIRMGSLVVVFRGSYPAPGGTTGSLVDD